MTVKLKTKMARRRIPTKADLALVKQANFERFCIDELGFDTGWKLNDPSAPWHEIAKRFFDLFPCAQQAEEQSKERIPFEIKWRVYSLVNARRTWINFKEDNDDEDVDLKLESAQGDIAVQLGMTSPEVRYAYEDIQKKMKQAPWIFYEGIDKGVNKNPAWAKEI